MNPGGVAIRLVQCEAQSLFAAEKHAPAQTVSFRGYPAPQPIAPDCELAQHTLPGRQVEIRHQSSSRSVHDAMLIL
jgi:hypothetical protein